MSEATTTTKAGEVLPKPRGVTLEEPPTELIQRAAEAYQYCWVKVARRNQRGQLQTCCTGARKDVEELLDLEKWLHTLGGGGEYRVETRNPEQTHEQLVPPFIVRVAGAPRPLNPKAVPEGFVASDPGVPYVNPMNPASYTSDGRTPQAYQPPPPEASIDEHFRWARGLPEAERNVYIDQLGARLPPPAMFPNADPAFRAAFAWVDERTRAGLPLKPGGIPLPLPPGNPQPLQHPTMYPVAQHTSDEVAIAQLKAANEELKAERKEREKERATWEAKLQHLLDSQSAEREKAREEMRRIEKEANDERFRQLQLQFSQPKTSAYESLAPLAAAIAPVLAAFISAGKERDATALQLQAKQAELQQQSQQQFMAMLVSSMANKKDGSEFLMPLLLKQMEISNPANRADLISTLGEQNVTQMGMLMEAVQAASHGSGINWGEIIERVGHGVMSVMSSAGRELAPGPQLRNLPGVAQAARPAQAVQAAQAAQGAQRPGMATQPTHTAQDVARAVQVAQTQGQDLPPAAQLVAAIMTAPGFPADFQTAAWRDILLAVVEQRDPSQVAEMLLDHLDHLLLSAGQGGPGLPAALHDLSVDPERALHRVFSALPLGPNHRVYISHVVQLTLEGIREAQDEEGESDGDEGTDAQSTMGADTHGPMDTQAQDSTGPEHQSGEHDLGNVTPITSNGASPSTTAPAAVEYAR